jgi:hypothetical protein
MKQPSRVESDIPIIGVLNSIIEPIRDKNVKEEIYQRDNLSSMALSA